MRRKDGRIVPWVICVWITVTAVKDKKNYEAGLHILREVGQRFDEAITMGNLGIYFLEERSLERAKEYFEGSVTLSQQL